ncbi:MAG: AMP-binding protein [Candidatus Methylomirabilia bacterium]
MHVGYLLTRAAQRYAERAAWLEGDIMIAFREAERGVNRLARALLSLGGQPGDRVAMLLPNCYQGLETLLAPMKAGMAVVPMNVRLHPSEHEYMLNDSGAFALVYGAEFRAHLGQIRGNLTSIKHFICVGLGASGDLGYEELLDGHEDTPPEPAIDPDDLAWIFCTSGTTGHPKGAMLTHRNLITLAEQFLLDINPVEPGDVLLHAAPITHGSRLSIFHHIARGAASAFPPTRSFDPPRIFEAIQRYQATTMFLAPTMVHMLVTSPDKANYDLSSLHTIFYGGGPMYVEQLVDAVCAFGSIRELRDRYWAGRA